MGRVWGRRIVEIEFTEQANKDLDELTTSQIREIRNQLEELRAEPTSHDDVSLIQIQDRSMYRMTVRNRRGGELDHRIIFDIEEGMIRIYSVFHRDRWYRDHGLKQEGPVSLISA